MLDRCGDREDHVVGGIPLRRVHGGEGNLVLALSLTSSRERAEALILFDSWRALLRPV